MQVQKHKVTGIPFRPARHTGGAITPSLVVLHDTAGRLTKGNSADYLRDNDAKVSAHFVIERDGSIEQQVPTNRRANHAGASSYHGRPACNNFSIGIEIVNPGRMALGARFAGGFQALAWWGQSFRSDEYDLAAITTPEHGAGVWMGYSEDQLISIINLLDVLFRDIPTLTDIRGHWYVSPGRKVDPNPLFPMEQIRARILGRDDPSDLEAIDQSEPVRPARAVQVSTGGSGLNMRRWPSINPNILASIPNGTILPVIRAGEFGGQRWNLVVFDGREGWVVDAYTKAV